MASDGPTVDVSACLAIVRKWQTTPGAKTRCPLCQADGLVITDRSARPHAEWYVLTCEACGFDATVNVPTSSAGQV